VSPCFVDGASQSADSTEKTKPRILEGPWHLGNRVCASVMVSKTSVLSRTASVRKPFRRGPDNEMEWPLGPVALTTNAIADSHFDPLAF
jgi:hypothetical protein